MPPPNGMRYRRVTVIGSSGAGKTQFARELHELTALPIIRYDRVRVSSPGVRYADHEMRKIVRGLVAEPAWILDGRGDANRDIIWPRTQLLIWLKYPIRVIMYRKGRKTWRQMRRPWANRTWAGHIADRVSNYLAVGWNHYTLAGERRRRFANPAIGHVDKLVFSHPAEAAEWLRRLGEEVGERQRGAV